MTCILDFFGGGCLLQAVILGHLMFGNVEELPFQGAYQLRRIELFDGGTGHVGMYR